MRPRSNPRYAGSRFGDVLTLLVVVGLFSVLAVGGGALWLSTNTRPTVDSINRKIERDLPPNCDRRTVEEWCDRNGIKHSYLAQHGTADFGGIVQGEIGSIYVSFTFDRNGRLTTHFAAY